MVLKNKNDSSAFENTSTTLEKKPPQKMAFTVVAAILCCALILSAFTIGGKSQEEETETVYKESTVTKGDLTVGITESGTATIQAVSVYPLEDADDVTLKIEEILIKAGQEVSEGDIIAKVSVQDIQEQLDELNLEYQKASVSLSNAKLNQEMSAITAQNDMVSTQAKSDSAELAYELTLKQLETELASSELSLAQLEDSIQSYRDQLAGELWDDYNLDDLREKVEEAQEELSDWEWDVLNGTATLDEDSSDSSGTTYSTGTVITGSSSSGYVSSFSNSSKTNSMTREEYNALIDRLITARNDAQAQYEAYEEKYIKATEDAANTENPEDGETDEETATLLAEMKEHLDQLYNVYLNAQEAYDAVANYTVIESDSSSNSNSTNTSGNTNNTSTTSSSSISKKTTELENAVEQAENNYESAYKQYIKACEDAEDKIESLLYDYESQQLKLETSEANKSLQEVEAQTTKDQTISSGTTAEQVYQVKMSQLENEVTNAQLSLNEVATQIQTLKGYLTTGEITAPCSGLVMSVNCSEGDKIQGSTAIATIANSQNVYVDVSISQDDIADIQIGKEANVQFAAYDQKFTGSVDSITIIPARSGASTVSYTVEIKLDSDTTEIYEGMTGDVTFITKEIKDVLYVTNKAVTLTDGISTVKVKDAEGNITVQEVTTGFSDGRNVEIQSGLTEGQTVLIESKVATK